MKTVVYPLALNQNEIITELEPKQQAEFPDRLRFPPIDGKNGECGCLMTYWEDDGGVKLETIWQPLWDTQTYSPGIAALSFFQNPAGRSDGLTNVPSIGNLTWPKKFHLWELVIQSTPPLAGMIRDADKKCPIMVVVQIGEMWHYKMPLTSMHRTHPGTYRGALMNPLFIPSVKPFCVTLLFGNERQEVLGESIRVVMNGYLHREIP